MTKSRLLFAIFLFITCSPLAHAAQDIPSLDGIDELIKTGAYQEALIRHQNYFEESAHVSGLAGVRLSFALGSWAELGSLYPPALEALQELANIRRQKLLSGDGSFTIFSEYKSINNYLNKDSETISTFLEIEELYPEEANDYYLSIRRLLMKTERYDIIARYITDPIREFESIRYHREIELSRVRLDNTYELINYADQHYQSELTQLLKTTRAVGMEDYAKEIERRSEHYLADSMKFFPNKEN